MRKGLAYILCALGLLSCDLPPEPTYGVMYINYTDAPQVVYVSAIDSMTQQTGVDSLNAVHFSEFDKDKRGIPRTAQYLGGMSYGKLMFPHVHDTDSIFYKSGDGKLRFYFISDSVFMRNPWATIVKRQMYDRKLVFTKEQLDSLNWTIEYR